MPERGGPQRIPRPPGTRPGDRAPWHDLVDAAAGLGIDQIRSRLAEVGAPRSSPIERLPVRASAVLAPLYEDGDGVHVILTRRAWHLRSHTGEVSFPGGGQEDHDPDLRATALRETHEEIGLDPAAVEIVGELDHLATVTSRSFIVPYVGLLEGRPDVEPDPNEVDAVLHVPITELLLPEVYREERWGFRGIDRPIWFFELVGDTVWGATAAMLRDLLVKILPPDA